LRFAYGINFAKENRKPDNKLIPTSQHIWPDLCCSAIPSGSPGPATKSDLPPAI